MYTSRHLPSLKLRMTGWKSPPSGDAAMATARRPSRIAEAMGGMCFFARGIFLHPRVLPMAECIVNTGALNQNTEFDWPAVYIMFLKDYCRSLIRCATTRFVSLFLSNTIAALEASVRRELS